MLDDDVHMYDTAVFVSHSSVLVVGKLSQLSVCAVNAVFFFMLCVWWHRSFRNHKSHAVCVVAFMLRLW